MTAESNGDIDVVSVGFSLAASAGTGSGSFTIALAGTGAQAKNTFGDEIKAYVDGATVAARSGNVLVTALDKSSGRADAGAGSLAVAVSTGSGSPAIAAAIGVSLASNTMRNTVMAFADNGATVTASGRVEFSATSQRYDTNDERVVALAVAVAVSVAFVPDPKQPVGFAFSGAGTDVENLVENTVEAYVRGSSTVTATGTGVTGTPTVLVQAKDDSTTDTDSLDISVAVAVGFGIAIGVALAESQVKSKVDAYIGAATVTATAGEVKVAAISNADSDAYTFVISITIAIGGAGGGARADADVAGYTKARLLSGASVSAGGAVTVSSDATSRAHAKGEGGSGGVLAITVILAEATTTSTTLATIESGAAITSSGSVKVASTRSVTSGNTQTTLSEIVLASVALLAGAGGTSDASDSGEVTASVADGASVTSTGPIEVTSTATTSTKASGNGGTGGAIGVTVILVTSTASGAVNAVIGDATVSGGKVDVIAKASTTVDVQLLTITIAIIGGAGGSATAKSTGDTTARIGVAQDATAPTTPKHLDVTGDITVLAGATHSVTSDTDGGAGGGVGIGGIISTATIEGDTRAYTGPGAWVKGKSLTIRTTDATGGETTATVRDVEANSIVGTAAILAGSGSTSTAKVTGNVEAFVGAGATIEVTGALTIEANSDADAFADARGGSGGGVAVSAFFANARIAPENDSDSDIGVRAYIASGAQVTTGSLDVKADSTDTAKANVFFVNIGLLSGAGAKSTAKIDSDVEAFIGSRTGLGTTVIRASRVGNVKLDAKSNQLVTADGNGGGGGVVNVSSILSDGKLLSTTQAFLGDGTSIPRANDVVLTANTTEARVKSDVTVGSGGGVNVGTTEIRANGSPTVRAFIGDAVTIGDLTVPTSPIPIAGDVELTATGRAEVDGTGTSSGGGVINVSVPDSRATVDPTVEAYIGRTTEPATRSTVIYAGGSVTVKAELSRSPTTDVSDLVQAVSLSGDTLSVNFSAIREGDRVMFSQGSTTIGGLHNRGVYTVLDAGTTLIRLGSLFDVSAIDALRETITFDSPHPFVDGDCIFYDPREASSMILSGAEASANGCTAAAPATVANAKRYFVRVLDDVTIQLTSTFAAATTDTSKSITGISPTQLTLNDVSGIVVGTPVTYTDPSSRTSSALRSTRRTW